MLLTDWAGPQRVDDRRREEFVLLDRRTERAAIDRILNAVRSGFSGTLVLRGGPGVGKSTLLHYAVEAAPDLRVCGIAGVESEISMEFGGLHQLLVPCLSELDDLPPPQRGALRVAFGQEAGPPPERFLVGLAALTLLSRAAEAQPLLCIIDDAHWLDPESAQVLGFRRPPPVRGPRRPHRRRRRTGRAAGIRAASGDHGGRPARRRGASSCSARWLAEPSTRKPSTASWPTPAITRSRWWNSVPSTRPTSSSGRAVLPEPLPLGQRLQEHFLRQVRSLPPDAQAFALLAAADPAGDRDRLWRAADRAGIDPDAASAETAGAGVLEFPGSSVRFRYPLLRSAVYHGASAVDRRQAHRALADAGHPELRVWHLAAAAVVPDEKLAAELQHTAERAGTRGGYAARAALLRRSADLTPDDARRAEREVALAEARLMAGDPVGAQDILGGALPRLTGTTARSRAQRLEGAIRFAQGDAAEAARILASASQAARGRRQDGPRHDAPGDCRRPSGPARHRPGKSPAPRGPSRLSPLLRRQSPICCSRGTAPGLPSATRLPWSRSAPR